MSDRVLSVPALRQIGAALEERRGLPLSLGGAWGSSYALILAALRRFLDRPLLLLVPGDEEEAREDLRTFGEVAELLPEPAADSPHLFAERFRLARSFREGELSILVTTPPAAKGPLPLAAALDRARCRLRAGDRQSYHDLVDRLVGSGFSRVHAVETPGEFAVRGGILDLFSPGEERPVRVEFFGETVESIREFHVADQRSGGNLDEVDLTLVRAGEGGSDLFAYLPEGAWIALEGEADIPPGRDGLILSSLPVAEGPNVKTLSLERFSGRLTDIAGELARLGGEVRVYCANEGEEARLREVLHDAGVARPVHILRGRLHQGFTFSEIDVHFIPHHELFRRYRLRRSLMKRPDARPIDSLLELQKGDVVVHLHHGIGRFKGMETLEGRDYMVVEYADHAKVYVPAADLDLVQKYVGGGEHAPPLHTLGGTSWSTAKVRAEMAVEELAKDMIRIQAIRRTAGGISYGGDTDWQRAFEMAFPYEETEDQTEVNRQIKLDLQSAHPMDRLVCGDVGYGKTELAMRAGFKVTTANRQVAVLVPTTVLAQQHFRTFTERMADYPIRIEVLSRFKTPAEQKRILEALEKGLVDIVIGTHRLVQRDVRFRDLGLVIVDEEQRFGVEHKEFLKGLRATVDVLTLTATPIPRTLHMSLLGIKEISALQTPPQDRRAIRTEVWLYEERRIREAILHELDRGGQVYFLHNRVYNIESVRQSLARIAPEARFGVGHGQMAAEDLEQVMIDFLEKKTDVLVCTTIIESGIDIPNVNTIFINNADQFGLSDLHQLRGRVGRYSLQAYCYLLLPRDRSILPQAKKRIKAIEEFSDLGAGFKIAMRDLEIRGVGNLLGREQSGHIAAVGYDLYLRMLERASRKMRNQKVEEPFEVTVDLLEGAYIPEGYAPDMRSRVELYRRLTSCRTEAELGAAREEMIDRFGRPPSEVERFQAVVRLKILCREWRISCLSPGKGAYVATYRDRKRAEALRAARPDRIRIVDDRTLWIVETEDPTEVLRSGPPGRSSRGASRA